jgi:mannose-6-phosphate isomerase
VASPFEGLRTRIADARQWLFDHAFPVWWEGGFDRASGVFHEKISQDGVPDSGAPRRTRVQARQTFAYAIAGRLGWDGPWREAVAAGCDVLLQRCLAPGGGARHRPNGPGEAASVQRDLYDTAFVVLGLAHGARALPGRADELVAAAESLILWTEAHWAHPDGGFREGDVMPTPPRRQNPHMHLLEALLALHETTGEARWLTRANRIATLFRVRFFDETVGVLPEFFDDQWRPMAGDPGRIVEPGHLFEWCWLLDQLKRAGGIDFTPEGERLRTFGERFGVDGAGFAMDGVWRDGAAQAATARLWPQTERLKANVARLLTADDPDAVTAAEQAFDSLTAYFATPVDGLWWDRREPDGRFRNEAAPASSFYHITLGLSELIHLA